MTDPVRINGFVPSWSEVSVNVGDEVITGLMELSYSDSLDRQLVTGMGRSHAPLGQTTGKYQVEPASFTVLKETGNFLRRVLAEQAGTGSFGRVKFEVVVQYLGADGTPITDELRACTYLKTSTSPKEDPEALTETIEIQPTSIAWNGLTLYDEGDGL